MILLIIFLLSSYGVTNIITSGKIFEPLRKYLREAPILGYWIKCPMCMGVPVGIGICALGFWPDPVIDWWKNWIAAGAASSGWCWMVRVRLHSMGEDTL